MVHRRTFSVFIDLRRNFVASIHGKYDTLWRIHRLWSNHRLRWFGDIRYCLC